ncbi:MAG: excinuclease ABC subunit UvrA [Clostridiales bacterium]|nr:excinuclease ABC subunit UvrA [Clostridiales bacterium]MDY5703076.1 excinuclease ABC subunit UvrA [Eubacteriales bacterium]
MKNCITIKGARENNLKNIDLVLPRNELIVFTGLSGSGKSSLAFETIFAEGQRRYVESLSSYARQFLGQMDKPDVDYIEGLSPAVSIDQKSTSSNPRSTVGTVTEINDYLRLLFARIGVPHCPKCGREITRQSIDQVVDAVKAIPSGSKIQIIAPLIRGRKGEHVKVLDQIRKDGYVRVKIDGDVYDINETPKLDKNCKHDIDVIIDRIVIKDGIDTRLSDSLETAFSLGQGLAKVDVVGESEMLFSQHFACPDCGISIEELSPRMFSFNNPYGACPSCSGLGYNEKLDVDRIIPDKTLSIAQGAIDANGWSSKDGSYGMLYFKALAEQYGFSLDTPWCDLTDNVKNIILYGTSGEKLHLEYEREFYSGSWDAAFEGIIPCMERRYNETKSDAARSQYENYISQVECPDCHGARLKPEVLAITIKGKSIADVCSMPVGEVSAFLDSIELSESESIIASRIFKELKARLNFLVNVGLDYLTLSRSATTLSGGEAQRIRLATQIGSGLVGVLYILDEPSIGLHQRDNSRLLDTLRGLRDLGNTLIVVEHDEETIRSADHIVDIGPGPGVHGGRVIAQGSVEDIMAVPESITGQFLSGVRAIHVPEVRRQASNGNWLTVKGCRENNLRNIDVRIPLGVFTCVTGVSGSGKSSLVNGIIKKYLLNKLNRAHTKPGDFDSMDGYENLDKVIDIDQSPIGRTPRSNPATYTGLFDLIREVFAMTPDAKLRGYTNGRFSFNVKGGRCESCRGDGIIRIEMHFLPDVYVPCEVCGGKRYNRETLEVKYKGKTIADVLDMTVEQALDFFAPLPKLAKKLQTLYDVGLGYIKLGQSSTTLSGGEAQRVKLSAELARRDTGRTLYILDEPTTGLHFADVEKLLSILQRLCDSGSSVLVIEHNLDVIKSADYIIDLGPEGGRRGGNVIASGTPEEVSLCENSYTGQYLRKIL